MKRSPADKAFSEVIREIHEYTCERCGKVGRMECSHIHSRRHRTIRWCLLNANCLCGGCHRWWHENPTESGKWFERTFGEYRVDVLLEKKENKVKVTKMEEKEIAKYYRKELNKMVSDRNYKPVSYQ